MNSLKNRFYLTLGYILSLSFCYIPSFRVVNIILRFFKNKIGKKTTIHNKVRFLIPFKIKIGNNTTINSNTLIDSRMGIEIGNNTMIGNNVKIYTLSHDFEDSNFKSLGKSVFIGDNVVVFPHVLIMPGVKIGNGVVIYPGAIVTKNVESYSIIAGAPAKQIGKRKLRDFQYKFNYKTYFGI